MGRHAEAVSKALEIAFLALTGTYLLYLMLGMTTFSIPFPSWFNEVLFLAMAAVTALRLLFLGLRRWEPWASAGMAAVYYMVFRSTSYSFLVYLGVLTAGLSGIDYRRILKTFLITIGIVFSVTVIAALSGAITNFVYLNHGEGIRSSWGFCYPTDFASLALFLLLVLWVVWRKLPDWAMLIPCAASALLAKYIAISDTSFICSLLFAAMILYHGFEKRVIARHHRLHWIQSVGDLLLKIAFPFCAVVMFALMALYHKSMALGIQVNDLLSNRLNLAVSAWLEHGLTAFGTPFEQIGNGFSSVTSAQYNFVDSSYPLILMRYGWVLLISLGILWGWTICRAIRCGDKRLALAMGLIAFHSFAEHHFTEVNYNILLVMPFAMYAGQAQAEAAPIRENRRNWIAALCTAVIAGLLLGLGAPRFLPWLKTVLQALQLRGDESGWAVVCIILGILAVFATALWAIFRIIQAAVSKRPFRQWAVDFAAFVVCACLAGGVWAYGHAAIAKATEAASNIIEEDRQAIEIIEEAAVNPIYSDVLPTVYGRAYPGVSEPVLSGEDLARYRGSTILADSDAEYSALINSGFLYSRISGRHAVYTADPAVAQSLKANGYPVKGYYDEFKNVDLAYEAELNGLDYDPETGLSLDGPLHSLTMGPYAELYAGDYSAVYDLQLPEGPAYDDSTVCVLRVSSAWGEKTLAVQKITGNRFDANGELSVSVPFHVDAGQGIEFLVIDEDAMPVRVKSIRWGRAADVDVHKSYDGKLRVTRLEYYSLDGEPTTASGGYFACEIRYDSSGNASEMRYYDADGQPALNNSGYAMVRRSYNSLKKITRQAYYGTDGNYTPLSSGQAIEERDYDQSGNIVCYRYYGADEKPVVISSGYAELRSRFNERNENIREDYIGADGRPIALESGQAALERAYDADGNIIEYRYYDVQDRLTEIEAGYAIARRAYNADKKLAEESFFNADDTAVSLGAVGYSRIKYEYDADNALSLVYYYDGDENQLEAGSANMHAYLQSLIGQDYTVFISIKDEGAHGLTAALLNDFRQLGIQTDLQGQYRNSFCAVVSPDGVQESLSSHGPVTLEGFIGEAQYSVASAGFDFGAYSSIAIDGVDYSKNLRGMNIVVYDNEQDAVISAVAFDTHSQIMTMTR